MDWFAWLSKTRLEPSLVHEYGLAFLNNELEEDDIPYLNHEFLQSMGISIAKHRLEILKLTKKETNNVRHPMSRILIVIKRTRMRLSRYLSHRNVNEETALSLVPKRSYSGRWKSTMMLKRNKKAMVANKQAGRGQQLLLTYGSPAYRSSRIESFSSPAYRKGDDEKIDEDSDHDEYWSSAVEEMRWDAMFQNLKPT